MKKNRKRGAGYRSFFTVQMLLHCSAAFAIIYVTIICLIVRIF